MNGALKLGAFDLDSPVGEGGTGVVWRGRHRCAGIPVAIKVLSSRASRRRGASSDLAVEVRAMASLSHPNIVHVFDQGRVSEECAAASNGALLEGAPYLVMELVEGRSLRERCGLLLWERVRTILVELLDALAHAHARGVIHRDIKPENVLLDLEGRPVLTDFGIAEALRSNVEEPPGRRRPSAGTPAYMSPEQISARWRDYGPWTDLYAVGCLAYDLIAGEPPFGASTQGSDLLAAHLAKPPPRFAGEVNVPVGLNDWLALMLEKSPERRFRRAADAIAALGDIETFVHRPASDAQRGSAGTNTNDRQCERGHFVEHERAECRFVRCEPEQPPRPRGGERATLPLVELGSHPEEPSIQGPPLPISRHPPLPPSWRRVEPGKHSQHLEGAGLGLHGLRPLPLVGRLEEREFLWRILSSAMKEALPAAVVLQGPSGFGKSRLARWLCESADEVGCANVLEAFHGPIPSRTHGLGPMVARALRIDGLTAREARERVLRALSPDGDEKIELVGRLVDLAGGNCQGFSGEHDHRNAIERRYASLAFLLERLSLERPVVVLLDDVQWGLEALGFALYLLRGGAVPSMRLLMLITVSEEALAEQPVAAGTVGELFALEGVSRMPVGPLGKDAQSELVRGLFGLSDELAAQVERRAGGNPLFVEQLVKDWVEREALVFSKVGYSLAPGVSAEFPANLLEIWGARIERALAARPEEDGKALEIAAVLGGRVLFDEWKEACDALGLEVSEGLIDLLENAKLVRRLPAEGPRGWAFVHGMAREALVARAERCRRLAELHEMCAGLLSQRSGGDVDERVGSHLLAAGALEEAIEPLTRAAHRRLLLGDARLAAAILGDLERAFEALCLEASDHRRTKVLRMWARRERLAGDCEAASAFARRAVEGDETAERYPDLSLSLVELGRSRREAGDPGEAEHLLARATNDAKTVGDEDMIARCRQELAWLCLQLARLEEARAHLEVARAGAERVGRLEDVAECSYALGWLAIQQERFDDAKAHLLRAADEFELVGSRIGQARCMTSLGDLFRMRGEMDEAEEWCTAALDAYRRLGHASIAVPLLNLSLVILERRRWAEAKRSLEEAVELAVADGRDLLAFLGRVGIIAASAGLRNCESCFVLMDEVEDANRRGVLRHIEVARAASLATGLLLGAGQIPLASRMASVGLCQWRALGRQDEAERLEEEISSAGSPAAQDDS